MDTAIVALKLEVNGIVDHIDVTLGGVVVPFENGAKKTVEMKVEKGRPHNMRAIIIGQTRGSIKITVDPGSPKVPISHLKSRIDEGQTSDVSYGEFTV